MGPPITKLPQGLMWYFVSASRYIFGMVVITTLSMISFLSASSVTFSLCWQDTTTVCTLRGTHAPSPRVEPDVSNLYSAVTWVLESGLAHHRVPSRRRSAIFLENINNTPTSFQ